jgi:hypothetical protein
MDKLSNNAKRLKRTLEELFAHQPNDTRLRDHLEGVRRDAALPGLTWFWGPELYRRNRAVYREFILAHFSDFVSEGMTAWRRVKWSDHAERLEAWLADSRRNHDTWLVRRLLRWKFAGPRWGVDSKGWCGELAREYQAARGPAARAVVLDDFDDWFELDERTALALYTVDRSCSKFLLKHLPARFSFWGGEKRSMWREMFDAARGAADDELAYALYRRQVDLKHWQNDIAGLARDVSDADRLNDELRRRHPEGWGLKLGDGVIALLQHRGRDVMPYVCEKLDSIVGGWYGSSPEGLLALARQRGWWDMWAAVTRRANDPKYFKEGVRQLLDDTQLADAERVERLRALAGVSREWNCPGLGLARVHSLDDEVATRLYRRYPQLVHGPFKPHVVPTWWQGVPQLLLAAQDVGDEELVDLLASRYVTRAGYRGAWNQKAQDAILYLAGELASSFQALRDRDEATFARRAANILTQIPAFSIYNFDQLLRTNELARLFFVRSFAAYLAVPAAVRDLVEGSEIHVQALAYRVLAQDDERARSLAVESLDILLGTLLRPLHRKTRLAAFGALASAAQADGQAAGRVLRRAREALRLPDKRYPKEQLVGLMGEILHRRPELRGSRERPVVFGLEEAVA